MKVLLADEMEERAAALADHLAAAGVGPVVRLASGERLLDAVRRHAPDVVIVDMARADRDSLEPIREVTAKDPKPIVMFADGGDAFMEEAIAAGVSSYNVRGTSLPDVKPIVRAAVAIFRRYQTLATELKTAESRLDDQAAVQRAKKRIMRDQNLSEPQAHRWLQRRAMNSGLRLPDVARRYLATDKPREES